MLFHVYGEEASHHPYKEDVFVNQKYHKDAAARIA